MDFFNIQIKNINIAAFVIAIFVSLSGVLSVVRNSLLASVYGAGDELDIYFAAFKIPDLVFNIIFFGAISAAFLPIFSGQFKKDPQASWRLTNNFVNISLLFSIIVIFILFLLMPFLISLIAPGFHQEKIEGTIEISRILLFQALFLGISSIFSSINQSFRKFLIFSLAPILYNIGIILGIIALTPIFGLKGLAYGVILGAILHLIIHFQAVRKAGYQYQFIFNLYEENIKNIFLLAWPRSLNLIVNQANLIIIVFAASLISSGALAIFNLANDLINFVVVALSTSFAVAAFPTLASLANEKNYEEIKKIINDSITKLLFILIPISGLFFILKEGIIRIILGYGKFDEQGILLTINTLGILALAIIPVGLIPFIIRVFFSLNDTKIPFFTSLIAFISNFFLIYILKPYGITGVALSVVIANFINATALLIALEIKIKWLTNKFFTNVLLILAKSFFTLVLAYLILLITNQFLDTSKLFNLFVQVSLILLIVLLSYFLLNRKLFFRSQDTVSLLDT